jgi:hypothetical protein
VIAATTSSITPSLSWSRKTNDFCHELDKKGLSTETSELTISSSFSSSRKSSLCLPLSQSHLRLSSRRVSPFSNDVECKGVRSFPSTRLLLKPASFSQQLYIVRRTTRGIKRSSVEAQTFKQYNLFSTESFKSLRSSKGLVVIVLAILIPAHQET